MKSKVRACAATGGLLMALSSGDPALAQKQGGILKTYNPDSPASMSILEEATVFAEGPMMGVFHYLVCTTRTCLRTVCSLLCQIWLQAGRGTRTGLN